MARSCLWSSAWLLFSQLLCYHGIWYRTTGVTPIARWCAAFPEFWQPFPCSGCQEKLCGGTAPSPLPWSGSSSASEWHYFLVGVGRWCCVIPLVLCGLKCQMSLGRLSSRGRKMLPAAATRHQRLLVPGTASYAKHLKQLLMQATRLWLGNFKCIGLKNLTQALFYLLLHQNLG